jgi:hypothetical protein
MNREYTEQDYYNYMRVVEDKIWKTEVMLQEHEKRKKVTKLSFEQWVQWQDGKLSLDDIKIK